MKVHDAVTFFGSRAEIARHLEGVRHRSAVYQWPDDSLVPLGAAFTLEKASHGELKVNPALYAHAHKARRLKWQQKKPRVRKAKGH